MGHSFHSLSERGPGSTLSSNGLNQLLPKPDGSDCVCFPPELPRWSVAPTLVSSTFSVWCVRSMYIEFQISRVIAFDSHRFVRFFFPPMIFWFLSFRWIVWIFMAVLMEKFWISVFFDLPSSRLFDFWFVSFIFFFGCSAVLCVCLHFWDVQCTEFEFCVWFWCMVWNFIFTFVCWGIDFGVYVDVVLWLHKHPFPLIYEI